MFFVCVDCLSRALQQGTLQRLVYLLKESYRNFGFVRRCYINICLLHQDVVEVKLRAL